MSSKIRRFGNTTTGSPRDGLATFQNVTASTAMTLDGQATTINNGVREFVGVDGRAVAIGLFSSADMTAGAGSVTVVGFADFSRQEALTEDILLPNNAFVVGAKHFAVVTSITPDTSIAEDLQVGTNANGLHATSADMYIQLDHTKTDTSIQVTATGLITASVAVSMDPIIDGAVRIQDAVFVNVTNLDAISGTEQAKLEVAGTMIRARYSSAQVTDGLVITVIEG